MKNNYLLIILCDVFILHIQHAALHNIILDWWTPYYLDFVSDFDSVSFVRENSRLLFTLNFNAILNHWIGKRVMAVKVDLL